jgi:lipopolysaccharide export system permease protein
MIFIPAVIVGIIISIVSFFANDVLLPAGTIQFAKLYRRILISTPALELEANSVKRFKDTTIVTGPVEGTSIANILIMDRTNDGERRIILAQDAELKDAGREGLSLDLSKAFIQSSKEIVRNDYDYAFTDSLRYWVPQNDLIQAISTISPNQMSTTDLRRAIAVKGMELDDRLDIQYGKYLTFALDLEDSLRKSDFTWNRRENTLEALDKEYQIVGFMKRDRSYALYRFEYNQKYAVPFGALSFVFLAVSLGLYAKKSGQTVGFIFGMIISCLFWVLLFGGKTAGVRLGYSPFLTMWLPNIIANSAGSILFAIKIRR